jgi:hypothetical protein
MPVKVFAASVYRNERKKSTAGKPPLKCEKASSLCGDQPKEMVLM